MTNVCIKNKMSATQEVSHIPFPAHTPPLSTQRAQRAQLLLLLFPCFFYSLLFLYP